MCLCSLSKFCLECYLKTLVLLWCTSKLQKFRGSVRQQGDMCLCRLSGSVLTVTSKFLCYFEAFVYFETRTIQGPSKTASGYVPVQSAWIASWVLPRNSLVTLKLLFTSKLQKFRGGVGQRGDMCLCSLSGLCLGCYLKTFVLL